MIQFDSYCSIGWFNHQLGCNLLYLIRQSVLLVHCFAEALRLRARKGDYYMRHDPKFCCAQGPTFLRVCLYRRRKIHSPGPGSKVMTHIRSLIREYHTVGVEFWKKTCQQKRGFLLIYIYSFLFFSTKTRVGSCSFSIATRKKVLLHQTWGSFGGCPIWRAIIGFLNDVHARQLGCSFIAEPTPVQQPSLTSPRWSDQKSPIKRKRVGFYTISCRICVRCRPWDSRTRCNRLVGGPQ